MGSLWRVILGISLGVAVLLAAGCETKNVGTAIQPERLQVHVTAPAGMNNGVDATWIAVITGGTPPYSVSWDFGGGANPNTISETTEGNSVVTVNMLDPSLTDDASFSGTVTVTDSAGLNRGESFSYVVGPGGHDHVYIGSATFSGAVLNVTASSTGGNPLTATVTVPAGAAVDATSKDITGGTATFTFSAESLVAGVSGTVTVTVDNGTGASDTADADLVIDPLDPAPDTLYALNAGGTIVILTGALPNPFRYLNGVGLTVDGDLDYEATTFNVGAPGGAAGDIDGAWTGMNPAGGFLLPPDNFIIKTDISGGRGRIDFNLTPIGGSDVAGMEGMLINFGLTGSPGTYTLGFQEFNGVNRTYYTDGATNIYHWGTLMADETGALATGITVDNTYTIN